MKNCRKTTRCGFTLVELIVTTTILATLSVSCLAIVRTSYTAWNRHEKDHTQRFAGLAVLKHIGRQTRQARAVVATSLASDNSGTLSLIDTNGNLLVWDHDAGSKQVLFGINAGTNVLATGIEELTFVGFKADGTTATTDPGLIHMVQCSAKVNLTRPSGTETVTTSSKSWLRAW